VTSSYGALDVETSGADVGIEVEHAPARLVDAPVDLTTVRGPPEQIDAADVGVGADSQRGVARHHEHEPVDVAGVIRVMHENRERVQQLLLRLIRDFPREHQICPIGSDRALDFAVMTTPEKRDSALLKKLDAVAGRVLGSSKG